MLRVRRCGKRVVRRMLGPNVVSPAVVLPISVIPSGRLRTVRHHLHAARHDACRTTATCRVGRRGRAAEAVVELLKQRAAHVVGGDVNGIGNAHNDERPLSGHGEAGV